MKLSSSELHLLRLAKRDAEKNGGWAPVSEVLWPFIAKLPDDLVERVREDVGGKIRLTDRGDALVLYS